LSATPSFLLRQNAPNVTKLTLASHPSNIALVSQLVDKVSQKYRLSDDLRGSLMISLTEAVNNAIIHGNRLDPSKQVNIHLQWRKNKLCIQVSDQGNGFDHTKLPDPTCPEHICNCGGRGVYLINELCEKVEYVNGGSTVKMQLSVQ
jgi:serine/threonine-protein kinase RsbW